MGMKHLGCFRTFWILLSHRNHLYLLDISVLLTYQYIYIYNYISHYITVYMHTSSTAQGGGGSFKNRKPIGEIGCCESRMAERIH